jgi:glycosyltransferase involved in cell wall biosynthesis
MRILLLHTFYQQKGGEDAVVKFEQSLLSQSEDVRTLTFENLRGLTGARQFLFSLWNVPAAKKLKKAILEFNPDVIHMHNLHFAIGPVAIRVANRAGVPIVLTLHNYRLLCPSTTLTYKGKLFTNSVTSYFPWKAVANRVYRNSFFQTFWLAFVLWFHRRLGTWKMVGKYIALTEFARTLFINSSFGITPDKFVVKPNFVNQPDFLPAVRLDNFLFVGRLSGEKGIHVLLATFSQISIKICIAGDGPLKQVVENACRLSPNIEYLGNLDSGGVSEVMRSCTALIFPSIWYEGMPMTILEAFSLGTPVIAADLGGISTMIRHGYNGLHFNPADDGDLTKQIKYWQSLSIEEKNIISLNARTTYKELYTPQSNLKKCLAVYNSVIDTRAVVS